MHVHFRVVLLLALCVFASSLAAQTPIRVSPTSFTLGGEAVLDVYISGLLPTDLAIVTFSGPGGTHSLEPTFIGTGLLTVWVPETILIAPGVYSVSVAVTRDGSTTNYTGASITIHAYTDPGGTPALSLSLPEIWFAAATGKLTKVDFPVSSTDGSPVTCTPASGSDFPLGTTTVSCSATNGIDTATGSFIVIVHDVTPPTITVPDDIVSENPVVTYSVTAEDGISGVTVTCNPASGATFPTGTTTVFCAAVDGYANFAFGTFDVTITNGTAPPVLTVPDDMLVEATSASGAVVNYTVSATEGGTINCTPASGTTFPLGTTTVTCTATNAGGSDTESFTVSVVDSTGPTVVSITATPDTLWPPNHKMEDVTITVVATDLVDDVPIAQIVAVESNQAVDGTGDGDTAPDWEITGPLTLKLRAERAGNSKADRRYTITVQVTDDSGNITTVRVFVRVTQSRGRK